MSIDKLKNEIPDEKYKDIMKLRLLETTFDSKMQEYQRTYKTYLSYTSSQIKSEWEEKYPATINNSSALMEKEIFKGDVTQDECFSSCANDDKCKYVLWSDSARKESNVSDNLCPNKCLKYTDQGGGLNLSKSNNYIKIFNPLCSNSFDFNTKYKFYGWEKNEWQINEDTSSSTLNDGTNWKNLGTQTSVDECNNKSEISELGPFSSVVYNDSNNTCYGGVLGGSQPTIASSGFTYSIPPGGQTGKIDEARISIITNLNSLNSELQTTLQKMYKITKDIYPDGIEDKESSKNELKKIFKKVKRLKADREKIKEMQSEVVTVDGQNEAMKLVHDANELLYLGVNILFVGIAGIVLAQFIKKK